MIDNKPSFSIYTANTALYASRLVGLNRRSFTYMDGPLFKKLSTSVVHPHLEYVNVAWYINLKRMGIYSREYSAEHPDWYHNFAQALVKTSAMP
jgi:hypothetical protein